MADEHKHTPFLFQFRTNPDGTTDEIWRCRSNFPVSDVVTDEDGNQVPGRTLNPGDPDHPAGEPCGWEAVVQHDPRKWTNERAAKYETQQALFEANAPRESSGSKS